MDQTLDQEKRALRRRLLSARRARGGAARAEAGRALTDVVAHLEPVVRAGWVAAYVSRGTEPGTRDLLELLCHRGVRVLVPVIGAVDRLEQGWAEYTGEADLHEPRPGRPPEPAGPDLGPGALAAADVVLVPALAVDTAGSRLGYGAGWYDRALGHVRPGTPLVALVYDDEVLDARSTPLPRGPHDQPVGSAATPAGWVALGADRHPR